MGGKPPANLPQFISMEWKLRTSRQETSASLEAGNGGGWEHAGCCLSAGTRPLASGDLALAGRLGSDHSAPEALPEHPREFSSPAQRTGADTENCKG